MSWADTETVGKVRKSIEAVRQDLRNVQPERWAALLRQIREAELAGGATATIAKDTAEAVLRIAGSTSGEYTESWWWASCRVKQYLPEPTEEQKKNYILEREAAVAADIEESREANEAAGKEWEESVLPAALELMEELKERGSRLVGELREAIANQDSDEVRRLLRANQSIEHRHEETDYDELLARGIRKEDARAIIENEKK
jgi:hypothetical protein